MRTDRCGNTSGQECHAKGSRKETKIQEFMYRDTTNVEHEMYDYTGSDWSHRSSNKSFTEKFGNYSGKTFNRYTTRYDYTWNITHKTKITEVWNLKPERWGSPLVQEKCHGEKACDERQRNNNNNNNNRLNSVLKLAEQFLFKYGVELTTEVPFLHPMYGCFPLSILQYIPYSDKDSAEGRSLMLRI
jgi:hypothetical protein